MRVTAVVVNHNGAQDLPACLAALGSQDHAPLEIIVVDNASTDGSDAILRTVEAAGRVRVLWNHTNRGYAGALNDALAVTRSEAVLVCNTDIEPAPDHVGLLVAALAADPARGSVQGRLLRRTGPGEPPVIDTTGHLAFRTRLFRNRGEGRPDRGQWAEPGPVFGVSGALALHRREMLEDVATAGGEVFDETLFAFFEDIDLDWRARLRGWDAWYEPRALAVHERGGAGPRRTPFVEELNFANRLLAIVKCDDRGALARAAPGVAATTLLKALDLLVTSPRALARAVRRVLQGWRDMQDKRAELLASARRTPADVSAAWFEPFDYGEWLRTWWKRVGRR